MTGVGEDRLRALLQRAGDSYLVRRPDPGGLVLAARRRRRQLRVLAAGASAVVAASVIVAALVALPGPHPGRSIQVTGTPPPTPTSSVVPTPVTPVTPASSPPTFPAPVTTPPTLSAPAPTALPVSVESDAQMRAQGNDGPSSSILAPASCTLSGTRVVASGGYSNGGFAPNVYNRYGDVVEIYVYSSAGRQLADLAHEQRPPIGGYGTWQAVAPVDTALGPPARCVVAAQPTHAFQGAPG